MTPPTARQLARITVTAVFTVAAAAAVSRLAFLIAQTGVTHLPLAGLAIVALALVTTWGCWRRASWAYRGALASGLFLIGLVWGLAPPDAGTIAFWLCTGLGAGVGLAAALSLAPADRRAFATGTAGLVGLALGVGVPAFTSVLLARQRRRGVSGRRRGVSRPRRGVSGPRRGVSGPRRGVSRPRRGVSGPRRGVSQHD